MKLKTALLAVSLMGCVSCSGLYLYETSSAGRGYGPPPHAPAHGYRHQQANGVELRYDARRGVYVVVGLPRHYYYRGSYFRYRDGHWEASNHIGGGWQSVPRTGLPPGLRG